MEGNPTLIHLHSVSLFILVALYSSVFMVHSLFAHVLLCLSAVSVVLQNPLQVLMKYK